MIKHITVFTLIIVTLFALANCKKGTLVSPTAITAAIMINGNDMTNGTMSGPNQNDRMTIRAEFSDPQGNHTIRTAVASYTHGHGMMNHMGQITLWDDGTHGDHIPGDGWFTMEDDMIQMMSMMGNNWNQIMGSHEFEIYCLDEDGNESNHITVHMDIQ
ncbi:MAG: hypothetical protein GTO45_15250 [Candidatus Aminicenantes bacterium]|nr:hypothetical protein [Candidatus Aminicenantes bacterium]NIM80125.1 hypothetical protein [Candidatus Aminicenantes bacterium]NIN19463.1 hypothetical protein [Candidatus Aminicenantes bacterium]NIN43362.1 hypothetical protein [Candidatus Aminicenantes bacterium]NIN86107.1 hypothetical protein [Candidatus Aminicenantes bacterium]